MSLKQIASLYREYLNNFLTIEYFSEYNGFSVEFTKALLKEGKALHELGY